MIRYYELFSMFKLAVIFQQIFVRFRMGYTADERFRNFDQSVRRILEEAAALL